MRNPRNRLTATISRSELSAGYELAARWDSSAAARLQRLKPVIKSSADPEAVSAGSFADFWSITGHLSLVDAWRAREIYRRWASVQHLSGDSIECGVFCGGVSLMLALALDRSASPKKVHLCDTFVGLPRPDRKFDRTYKKGSMAYPKRALQAHIRALGVKDRCVIHSGLFSRTFPKFLLGQRFNFAHIDCDLFKGTAQCLDFLADRMDPGAVIVVDDYYDESHGVMRAVNHFAARTGTVIHLGTPAQATLVIGETFSTTRAQHRLIEIDGERVCIATGRLRRIRGLEDFYRSSADLWHARAASLDRFIETVYGPPRR